MPTVTIASIYPIERVAERPKYRGLPYVIPAAPKGEVVYLTVDDEVQQLKIPLSDMTVPQTVFANDIANCLVSGWTGNGPLMAPGQQPGITVIAGTAATPEEKLAMEEAQTQYFMRWVEWADGMERDKKASGITALARVACRWLLLEREWLREITAGSIIPCRFCGKSISVGAVVCPICANIVDPKRYAALKAANDEMAKPLSAVAPVAQQQILAPEHATALPPPLEPGRTKAMGMRT
jgi:hypothetical protein